MIFSALSQAASISYTFEAGGVQPAWLGSHPVMFDFPQFTEAPGVKLNSVTLMLQGTSQTEFHVSNPTPVTFTYRLGAFIYAPVINSLMTQDLVVGAYPFTGTFNAPAGQYAYTAPIQTSTASLHVLFPENFVGSGLMHAQVFQMDYGPDAGPGSSLNPLPYSDGRIITTWSAVFTATYDYSVPEPATGGMVAAGLIAALWALKNRRAS